MEIKSSTYKKQMTAAVSAVAITGTLCMASVAQADEAYAYQTFQAMSDYLGSQTSISFDYGSALDVVTQDNQKLSLVSSGTISLVRPGTLFATRDGGFANIKLSFDGKVMNVINSDVNMYATIDAPGSIDELIDTLRKSYGQPLPAADLLSADVAAALTPLFTDAKDLGAGVIGGVTCDHFAFRTDIVDIQIWIAQGDEPYPCRYVLTDTKTNGWPEYQLDVSNWRTGDAASDEMTFELPADATLVDLDAVPNVNELSGIYSEKGN